LVKNKQTLFTLVLYQYRCITILQLSQQPWTHLPGPEVNTELCFKLRFFFCVCDILPKRVGKT